MIVLVYLLFYGIPALLSFVFAIVLSKALIFAAHKYDLLDQPDGKLKTHVAPVPHLGGWAIFLAVAFCIVGLGLIFPPLIFNKLLFLYLAGFTLPLFLLGFLDDIKLFSAEFKLCLQILFCAGSLSFFGYLGLGMVQFLLLLFVMLAIINSFNLLDVSDGLCGSVALPAACGFALLCGLNGFDLMAMIFCSLAGALVGFLFFNWQPAKIYLGDAGAFLLGALFTFPFVAHLWQQKFWLFLFVAIIFCGVPLAESAGLTFHRLRLGISPLHGSPHHIAHFLKRQDFSTAQVALFAGGASLVLSGIALVASMELFPIFFVATALLLGFAVWCKVIY